MSGDAEEEDAPMPQLIAAFVVQSVISFVIAAAATTGFALHLWWHRKPARPVPPIRYWFWRCGLAIALSMVVNSFDPANGNALYPRLVNTFVGFFAGAVINLAFAVWVHFTALSLYKQLRKDPPQWSASLLVSGAAMFVVVSVGVFSALASRAVFAYCLVLVFVIVFFEILVGIWAYLRLRSFLLAFIESVRLMEARATAATAAANTTLARSPTAPAHQRLSVNLVVNNPPSPQQQKTQAPEVALALTPYATGAIVGGASPLAARRGSGGFADMAAPTGWGNAPAGGSGGLATPLSQRLSEATVASVAPAEQPQPPPPRLDTTVPVEQPLNPQSRGESSPLLPAPSPVPTTPAAGGTPVPAAPTPLGRTASRYQFPRVPAAPAPGHARRSSVGATAADAPLTPVRTAFGDQTTAGGAGGGAGAIDTAYIRQALRQLSIFLIAAVLVAVIVSGGTLGAGAEQVLSMTIDAPPPSEWTWINAIVPIAFIVPTYVMLWYAWQPPPKADHRAAADAQQRGVTANAIGVGAAAAGPADGLSSNGVTTLARLPGAPESRTTNEGIATGAATPANTANPI